MADEKQWLRWLTSALKSLRRLIRSLVRLGFRTSSLTCYELGHTWTPFCRQASADVFMAALKYSFKIYASLYVVTALLKRKKPSYYLEVVWKDVLRSTVFLTTNAISFMTTFCTWRQVAGFYFYPNVIVCTIPISSCLIHIEKKSSHLMGGYNQTIAYLPALLTSAFSLHFIERTSRHGVLAMYTTNLALETLYNMLTARGLLPKVPYGEIALFSAALAGFLHLYRTPGAVDSFSDRVFSTIFGTDEVIDAPSTLVHSSPLSKIHPFLPLPVQNLFAQITQFRCLQIKHKQCSHRWSCLLNICEKLIRCFGIGYGINAALKIPGTVKLLLSGKNRVLQWLFSKDNFSCGTFIAGISVLHQGASCLLRHIRGTTDASIDGLISGGLAGLAMYFYQSPMIALYAFIRLADLLIRRLAAQGKIPTIKHAYVYMYAFSTAVLFHAGVWEPHNIRPTYWKFMLNLTGQKFRFVNRRLVEKIFEIESANLYPDFWPKYNPKYTSITTDQVLKDVTRFQ